MSDAVWLPVRFRDLDAFGHVYHAEYLTLLDEGRTAWFRDVLHLDDAGEYLLARVEIDYVSSVLLADRQVGASFTVERVGRTSLTLREELRVPEGRLVSRSRSVCVLRDLDAGRSRRLTDAERARAEELVVAQGPS